MLTLMVPKPLAVDGLCRPGGAYDDINFFPEDGAGVKIAKDVCALCPVREDCLDHALIFRIDHGVWGGASERQRRRILKGRKLTLAACGAPVAS